MSLLRDSLDDAVAGYAGRKSVRPDRVAAAVLIPLFVRDGEHHLLLTRRTDTVRDHKGQISFPGGAVEPHDRSLQDAALRETFEEVGIPAVDVRILGVLDDVVTHSGFHITPFVGRIPWPCPLQPDPGEVAEVLTVPLRDLLDDRNVTQAWSNREPGVLIYFYRSGPHTIWGITGWILKNFLDVIRRDTGDPA